MNKTSSIPLMAVSNETFSASESFISSCDEILMLMLRPLNDFECVRFMNVLQSTAFALFVNKNIFYFKKRFKKILKL